MATGAKAGLCPVEDEKLDQISSDAEMWMALTLVVDPDWTWIGVGMLRWRVALRRGINRELRVTLGGSIALRVLGQH